MPAIHPERRTILVLSGEEENEKKGTESMEERMLPGVLFFLPNPDEVFLDLFSASLATRQTPSCGADRRLARCLPAR